MRYFSFFTAGSRYEAECQRLGRSIGAAYGSFQKQSTNAQILFPHSHIVMKVDIDDAWPLCGGNYAPESWEAATRFTAFAMRGFQQHFNAYPSGFLNPQPAIYLDCDAFLWSMPDWSFLGDCDVACHVRNGEMLNGTTYLSGSLACFRVIDRYCELIQAYPACANEQTKLAQAVREGQNDGWLKFREIPPELCYIHDMAGFESVMAATWDNARPVIEHLQASREFRPIGQNKASLARRKSRVQLAEEHLKENETAYAILGITETATDEQIRDAFRANAKLCHPDASRKGIAIHGPEINYVRDKLG